ncbi:Acetoin catabolism regulatory protein [Gluconacetobacter sp. SXCC-1]|uniref:Sigma-54-dependent Fis family transcriptional regulator n=1 Tax=Komagataeibacter rhaeticus TaxID=215221 RepID=A0A181C8V4_9PROT|nr:helix-turn-helix domain-containing protein [Komagataeibacter rhaeticus]ATU72175.1 Fis family transcriptional regulator [Komagataeibacter xylinus]EGG75181.1 Acetoin catabolism regulatory protein [Gluconacetobacter sp. SXCC-1]KDU96339.1 Fis family transcriptional regulator [Komagataeibacter rhaeticus AF1]MBL7239558.1 sigma-54-dependent Fis family transcriptional regulator [Komagataeibacter rhaeticus]QIP34894.1 sigma-54-dependent Fis family transcriptional regulator [Komagataeibacter rhaeticus
MLHGARFLFSAPPIAAIPSAGTGLEGSWRRCQHEYGLDPATPALPCVLSGAELRQSCQRAGRVMHFAAPELDLLHAALEPVGYTVMLADIGGVVLDHRTAPPIRRGCRRWHFWPGAVWHERDAGTNGIGTCLAEQRSVSVHRNQHWRSGLHGLAGVATPVYDATGRMAACLNASSFRPTPEGTMGALLASALLQAARQIERTCFMDRYRGHAIMLLGAAMGSSVPMVALDRERHVVGATFAARMQMGIAPAQDVNLCLLDDTTAPRPGAPLREAQTVAIQTALASARGKVAVAARMLGVSRSTLHRRLRNLESPPA